MNEIKKDVSWNVVWDKSIIDEDQTTAGFFTETAQKQNVVLRCDSDWEFRRMNFPNGFFDNGKYRLYYLAHYNYSELVNGVLNTFICYAESTDGVNFIKPNLNICEYKGNKNNNIILRSQDIPGEGSFFDNFFVFKDTNPKCPNSMKYKALAYYNPYKLSTYVSPDGLHFEFFKLYDLEGKFDTLNTCFWDERIQRYVAYIRDFHNVPESGDLNKGIRDVRRTESEDFVNWTKPELITFPDTEDYPLYTNNVFRYYRNKELLIGFPARYVEKQVFTENFEELCGKDFRLQRMKACPRFGLAITDSILMTSYDGLKWNKIDEALFPPEMEDEYNWVYGDQFVAHLMIETTNKDGVNKDLSMYVPKSYAEADEFTKISAELIRYTFRRDGFACYKGDYKGAVLKTKKIQCQDNKMYLNFQTSARGSIIVKVKDKSGNQIQSCETFGNSDHRLVRFIDGSLADFMGKEVEITFELKDAKVYSFLI